MRPFHFSTEMFPWEIVTCWQKYWDTHTHTHKRRQTRSLECHKSDARIRLQEITRQSVGVKDTGCGKMWEAASEVMYSRVKMDHGYVLSVQPLCCLSYQQFLLRIKNYNFMYGCTVVTSWETKHVSETVNKVLRWLKTAFANIHRSVFVRSMQLNNNRTLKSISMWKGLSQR